VSKTINLLIIITLGILVFSFEGAYNTPTKEKLKEYYNNRIFSRLIDIEQLYKNNTANDKSELAWGAAQNILSLLRMFRITQDTSYLDTAFKYVSYVRLMRDDKRISSGAVQVVSYLDRDMNPVILPLWRNMSMIEWYLGPYPKEEHLDDSLYIRRYDEYGNRTNLSYEDDFFSSNWLVHTGNILSALSELALILDEKNLWNRYGIDRRSYIADLQTTADCNDSEWIQCNEYGVYGWTDKIYWRVQNHGRGYLEDTLPVHYNCSMAGGVLKLYRLTGEIKYLNKAKNIAQAYKRIISKSEGGGYKWFYWYHTFDDTISVRHEDISHGAISFQFANDYYELFQSDCDVFSSSDMENYAKTVVENMFLGDISHKEWVNSLNVYRWIAFVPDGSYDLSAFVSGKSYSDSVLSEIYGKCYFIGWAKSNIVYFLPLCKFDPRILEIAFNICDSSNCLGIPLLMRYIGDYKPAKVSAKTLKYFNGKLDSLEICFDSIRTLGDLMVKLSTDNEAIRIHKGEESPEGFWSGTLKVASNKVSEGDKIECQYYSDNQGITGPLSIDTLIVRLENIENNEIPFEKEVLIEYADGILEVKCNSGKAMLILSDVTGRIVRKANLMQGDIKTIIMSDLGTGIFFATVDNGKMRMERTIIHF